MTKKSTKYVITDTNEEVVFGDTVEVTLTKTDKKGHRFVNTIGLDVSPKTLPTLLEFGILEPVEEEEPLTNLDLDCDEEGEEDEEDNDCAICAEMGEILIALLKDVKKTMDSMDNRMEQLETKVQYLQNRMNHKATKPTDKK